MTESTPETGSAEQEASVGGGHFPNAVMPQEPYWGGGALPALQPKEEIVMFPDSSGTFWHALITDSSQGKITSAFKVDPGKLNGFISTASVGPYPRIDVIHVPPQPPPGGSDWLARFGLEVSYEHWGAALRAYNISKPL